MGTGQLRPLPSQAALGLGATLSFWALVQASLRKDPSPGAPLLLAHQPAGLGEWMGLACPSRARKLRHRERVRGGGKIRPTPGNAGLLRRVGLFVLLFSKPVCRKAEGVQLCFRLVWSARSGNNSSFTPKLTPADPSGPGLPRTFRQHCSAPQLSSFPFWKIPPHN